MACSAAQFVEIFFRELTWRDIAYVIIHSYRELPGKITSDIDYAVHDRDLQKILPIQREIAQAHGWCVVQTLHHGVFAYYTVLVNLHDPRENLKLDVCSHYARKRRLLVTNEVLLEGRRKFGEFFIPNPQAEFIYEMTKLFDAKKKSPSDYMPRLREFWNEDREGAQRQFEKTFGRDAGSLAEWFARPPEDWHRLRDVLFSRNHFGPLLLVREAMRILKRAIYPTGLHLALLGPDGAGKSTLISKLQPLLEPCFRRQQCFHFRPMFFEKKRSRQVISNPHAGVPRGRWASWLKLFYYALDQWAGYPLIIAAKLRSTLIIFDRNFDDVLVDPKRYRLVESSHLIFILRRLLPKPDLTFILDAPSELIHSRKPELPIEELTRQREVLQNLAKTSERYVLVRAEEEPNQVVKVVARRVVEFLAAREAWR